MADKATQGRPAAFLDRDGTVIEEAHYLAHEAQVVLAPGAAAAMRRLREAGYLLVMVTNQSGVGRGILTEEELARIHALLNEMLAAGGAALDDIYYCPHLPGAPVKEYDRECDCRKPGAGMLLAAAEKHGVDLERSVMIGDAERDVQAGAKAGCRTVLLAPDGAPESTVADFTAKGMEEAVERLLGERKGA